MVGDYFEKFPETFGGPRQVFYLFIENNAVFVVESGDLRDIS